MQCNKLFGEILMSKKEKVCLYCGKPESQGGLCDRGREHVLVSKERFLEVVGRSWDEVAKEKGW
jgi:hypothetical protein